MASPGRLNLRVLTPARVALDRQADYLVLRCVEGDKGVLPNHERYIARLQSGMLQVYDGKDLSDNLFVMGGTAIVEDNNVTVLSEMAGGVEEVKIALQRIEEELELRRQDEMRSDVEIHRAEVALRNALVIMDVSSYTVFSPKKDSRE